MAPPAAREAKPNTEKKFEPEVSDPEALRRAEGMGHIELGDLAQFGKGLWNGPASWFGGPQFEIDEHYAGAAEAGKELGKNLVLEATTAGLGKVVDMALPAKAVVPAKIAEEGSTSFSIYNPFNKGRGQLGQLLRSLGINPLRTAVIRRMMQKSGVGQTVLRAADEGVIELELSASKEVPRTLAGQAVGNTGVVFIRNTQSYSETVGTLVHEGVHAMGVGGSRRAEIFARIAEAMHRGETINPETLRKIFKEVSAIEAYKKLPWKLGAISPHFRGWEF